MVWACCWRSVDTRTYNATRIGRPFLLCYRRRRRPAQHQLVRLVPSVLPIGLLADLPPDLEGAPHGRLPLLAQPTRKGYTRRPARSRNSRRHQASQSWPWRLQQNLSLAIKPSSTRCGSVSRHWAGSPRGCAILSSRAVDLAGAGRLRPAAPGPPARLRPAAGVGAAPPARPAVALPGPQGVSAPAVRGGVAGRRAETLRVLPRPAQGPPIRPRPAPPCSQEAHQETQEEAAHHQGGLSGPTRRHRAPPQTTGLKLKLRP